MIEWAYKVPNNGLIRYYIFGNLERVLLTNPKALSELLVTKVYEFPKPQLVRQSLARVTGKHGVLLVEGDEHKVSGFCWSERESRLMELHHAEATKESYAGFLIPPHQEPLPHFLVQEHRNGQADRKRPS